MTNPWLLYGLPTGFLILVAILLYWAVKTANKEKQHWKKSTQLNRLKHLKA